jgi:uncharacterized sporulation protein YeaH/YhbH (DUF444 family)
VSQEERRLAKSFFFWALQGLRRQYRHIEPVFIAHTVRAWEFPEAEFFKVSGEGGTVASTAFEQALQDIAQRHDPSRYNIYFYYASDGENFRDDREPAMDALDRLTAVTAFAGYLETARYAHYTLDSETAGLFSAMALKDRAVGSCSLSSEKDLWEGIRRFFRPEADGGDDLGAPKRGEGA